MELGHLDPAPGWWPLSVRSPARETVVSFLQSWTLRALLRGHLGRMPVQETSEQVHCQLRKQSAVPRPVCRAGGPACLGHGGWRCELGAENTTLAVPSRPIGFLWQGRPSFGHAFPSWALTSSSILLLPCSPPSSLQQNAHSRQ